MQNLDLFLLSQVAHFAGQSWKLDYAVYCLSNSDLLKGGLFMTVLWGFWFLGEPSRERRTTILALLAGATLALGVGKAIENFGPYSPRPYQSIRLS